MTTFYAVDPSTRKPFAEIPETTTEQVAEMVEDARRALAVEHEWRKPRVRARVLGTLARLVTEQAEALAELACRDTGTPLSRAREEAAAAVTALEHHAGERLEGRRLALGPETHGYTLESPWGVCAQVISWRSPLESAARLSGAALAAGNAVILKPSERASIAPLRLAELAELAGVPRGMLQVATGDGTVGAALEGDHVTFAGSARVAGTVAAACAQRLVPFALELALAPVHMVFADAELDAAVAAIARGLGSRVLVERALHDELVARLEAALAALTVGPAHEDPDVGPQIDGELVRPGVVAGAEPLGNEVAVAEFDADGPLGASGVAGVSGAAGLGGAAGASGVGGVAGASGAAGASGVAGLGGAVCGRASVWTGDLARGHRVAAALDARHVSVNAYAVYPPPGGDSNPYVRTKTVTVAL